MSQSEGQTSEEELLLAVRDLWTMPTESGDSYVVLIDRRRMSARVDMYIDRRFHVSWEKEDGTWIGYDGAFNSAREAVFRAYQGPH